MKKITPLLLTGIVVGCGITVPRMTKQRFQPENNYNLTVEPVEPGVGSRVAILNNCSKDLWFQNQNTAGIPELTFIPAGTQYDIQTPTDVTSFKGWVKFNCDSSGQHCQIGQEVSPGCSTQYGCQPPIDTGVEFTLSSSQINYDISLVNGFTVPMSLTLFNSSGEPSCRNIDGSQLSINTVCPETENLSTPTNQWSPNTPFPVFGDFTFYNVSSTRTINLTSQDLIANSPGTNTAIGCFAPYLKLISTSSWGGVGIGVCPGNKCASQAPLSPVNVANTAFDDRVLMYANPYSGCDLAPTAKGSPTQNNCEVENQTAGPEPASFLTFAAAWKTLSASNGYTGYCSTPSGFTSEYCSDFTAAQPPIQSTAPSVMSRLGPIPNTQYVKNVHAATNNELYAYQYDDLDADYTCNSGATKVVYTVYCVQ